MSLKNKNSTWLSAFGFMFCKKLKVTGKKNWMGEKFEKADKKPKNQTLASAIFLFFSFWFSAFEAKTIENSVFNFRLSAGFATVEKINFHFWLHLPA